MNSFVKAWKAISKPSKRRCRRKLKVITNRANRRRARINPLFRDIRLTSRDVV